MSQVHTATVSGKNVYSGSTVNVRNLCLAAVFMALNIALSSFGVPVPGGHLYLCDVAIVAGAVLLDPVSAFIVGGVGSFLGDLLFYPAPMFVSLVTHGLQAFVISYLVHRVPEERRERTSIVAAIIGAIIMVVGYTLGKIFVYSTLEYAIIKLPFEIMQGAVGVILGLTLVWKCGLAKIYKRYAKD